MNRHPLFLAISLVLATSSAGWAQDHGERAQELDEVVVTASPLRQTADEIVRPVETLAGHALDDRRAPTIGETVTRIPGVQTSFFGPGVGRPIIRGLDGARVQMLSEGLSSLDVSTVSVDHAVTIEPFLADQIEVLKGPSTLLFGSGAIGGAVNVVDGAPADFPATRTQVAPPRSKRPSSPRPTCPSSDGPPRNSLSSPDRSTQPPCPRYPSPSNSTRSGSKVSAEMMKRSRPACLLVMTRRRRASE